MNSRYDKELSVTSRTKVTQPRHGTRDVNSGTVPAIPRRLATLCSNGLAVATELPVDL